MKFIPFVRILVLHNASKFCNLSLNIRKPLNRSGGGEGEGEGEGRRGNSQPGTQKRKTDKV